MKILLAIDGSKYSADAARAVAARLWPPDTTVRVLSAIESIYPPASEVWYNAVDIERAQQEMRKDAEQLVTETAETLRNVGGLTIETAVRDGDPRTVIVDEAKEWSADLIVMGSHGYTGLKRLLLGSVAHSVVSHAPCSVEVVRLKQTEND